VYADQWRRPWIASSSIIPTSRRLGHDQRSYFDSYGEFMAKFNYQQARRQKEVAKKARQQEKLQRRSAQPNASGEPSQDTAAQKVADPRERGPESGT
jgi:hypothetical protein